MKQKLVFSLLMLISFAAFCQEKKAYQISVIGFYNLENFYDTINQDKVNDDEFTPDGPRKYDSHIYLDKIERLTEVLSKIGTDLTHDGLAFFGVAEIENESVLFDLVNHHSIKQRGYKIVHYDSPDDRGVDVGLIYNPKYYKVTNSESLKVPLVDENGLPRRTRDVLWVSGQYLGEEMHVFVNHWPSRRGGEEASAPSRKLAAGVAKQIIDSLMIINPETKIVLMGDLNDDPISPSVAKVLGAKGNAEKVSSGELFNPWMDYYKKGIGTLAYNDSWNLFDQIIISHGFLPKNQDGVFYKGAHIFNRDFMIQQTGRYKGYPMRTWSGMIYNHGYSDHFPTYISLLKEIK